MHRSKELLEKENRDLKDSLSWYQRTYEKRTLAGIIKDRVRGYFLKPKEKVEAVESLEMEMSTAIVDTAKAKSYLKKKGEVLQQHFKSIKREGIEIVVPEKCKTFFKVNFETVMPVGNNLFIAGWIVDPEQVIDEVYFMFENQRFSQNVLTSLQYYTRNDVREHFRHQQIDVIQKTGFFGFITNNEGLRDDDKKAEIHVLTRNNELLVYECELTHRNISFINKVKLVLSVLDLNEPDVYKKFDTCIGPAIQKLNELKIKPSIKPWFKQFGEPCEKPEVSVVIPIYGRYDFIQFQLSQFCNDPYMYRTEVIYVIDDPAIFDNVVLFSNQIYPIYQFSFKLVYGGSNFGFAGANNFGVSFASSDYLLLLNSDVIPRDKGWLEKLLYRYTTLDQCGILGPTLLYEDNNIQHAGMNFSHFAFLEGFWFNEHPGKGTPLWLSPIKKAKEMPSVTGACMFISKEIYDRVGGFDESYILGDFEDSDLCLKIQSINYKCYYEPEIVLYHLERKSQSLFNDHGWKHKVTLYNGWQHTKRWNELIESIKLPD